MATQQELVDKLEQLRQVIEPGVKIFQQLQEGKFDAAVPMLIVVDMETAKYNDLLEQCANYNAAEDDEIGQLIKATGLKYRELVKVLKNLSIN